MPTSHVLAARSHFLGKACVDKWQEGAVHVLLTSSHREFGLVRSFSRYRLLMQRRTVCWFLWLHISVQEVLCAAKVMLMPLLLLETCTLR